MRGSVAPKVAVRSAAEVHQVLGSGPINLQKASDDRSQFGEEACAIGFIVAIKAIVANLACVSQIAS